MNRRTPESRSGFSPWLGCLTLLVSCEAGPEDRPPPPTPEPPPLPQWTEAASHPAYPRARYLAAVGVAAIDDSEAKAREEAEQRARRELVLILRADVLSSIQTKREVSGVIEGETPRRSRIEVDLKEFTEVLGRGTLDGARIVAHHESRARRAVYALAVMDRAVAARNMESRIDSMLADAETLLHRAQEGSRARSLGPLLRCYSLYLDARLAREMYRVLVGQDVHATRDRGTEVRARIEGILGDLRLEILRGQDQRGAVGAALPEPVIVGVTVEESGRRVPVPGMRFRLEPEYPDAVRLPAGLLVTGQNGEARFEVPLVRSTGAPVNSIRVTPEAGRLGSLEMPSVDVRYTLPTRETLRVLVVFDETNLGKTLEPPVVTLGIRDALRRAGYALVDVKNVLPKAGMRELLGASSERLGQLVGRQVDVLLRGRAETRESGMLIGLPATRGTVEIEGLDLYSDRVIVSAQLGPEPGAHGDRARAGLESLRNLAKDASELVVDRLAEFLSTGE